MSKALEYVRALYRIVEGSPVEHSILLAAFDFARAVGLVFQRNEVHCYFHATPWAKEKSWGLTIGRLRPVVVLLRTGLFLPDQLVQIAIHELHHAWDFTHNPGMPLDQHERRAREFTSRAMEKWRRGEC